TDRPRRCKGAQCPQQDALACLGIGRRLHDSLFAYQEPLVVAVTIHASSMNEITQILVAIEQGDPNAAARLLPLVYDELRRLAAPQMAQERPGQTIDATALVHEAYLRLAGDQKFDNRRHYFAAAAQAMRRILVENARRKGRLKRGGRQQREAVELDALAGDLPDKELLALHDALEQFAGHDPVKARLVELRCFGGMSLPEVAEHLGISLSTAERGWRYARAWLHTAMAGADNSAPA